MKQDDDRGITGDECDQADDAGDCEADVLCVIRKSSLTRPAKHHRNVPGDREPWGTTNILHSEEKRFQEKST